MLSRLSLRTILIGSAILVAVIPAAVLGIGSARTVRAFLMTRAMAQNELLAKGLAFEYEQFLTSHQKAVATIAAHAAAVHPFSAATLGPILARTRENYPAFNGMGIVDPSGKTIMADPSTTPEGKSTIGTNVSDRVWFRETMRTQRPFMDRTVLLSRLTKTPALTISIPIFDARGRLKGVVGAGLDVGDIGKLAARVSLGSSGHAVVTTAEGQPLVHPRAEIVRDQKNFSKLPIWPLVAAQDTGQVPSYVGTSGDLRLAGFATVPGVGWKVWVSRTISEIESEVAATYRKVMGWVAAVVLLAMAPVMILARTIARPMEELRRTASAIAAGDLARRAPEQGPQEVAALGKEFNRMAAALEEGGAERRRREEYRAAQHAVTRVLAESVTLGEATPRILQTTCETLRWDLGELWTVDQAADALRCSMGWHLPSVEIPEFEAISRQITFAPGVGLPGRVWASGEPMCIDDVVKDANFPRAPIAAKEGLHGAFAFPIRLGTEILGVLCFYSRSVREPDAELLQMFAAIGGQIGQFIKRTRAEEEVIHLNQDLQRRTTQLEAANKELEAFSYSISHDLRAPLRAIDGFSRILLEEYMPHLPEEARRHLHRVRDGAQQMGHLVDDLLAFSRLSRQSLKVQPVAPADLVHRILEDLRAEREGRHVEVSIGDLPSCEADPALLKQVFINLLDNALKFTRGRDPAHIEIGSMGIEDFKLQIADLPAGSSQSEICNLKSAIYFVRDNGVGFDMQYGHKLFGVFQRLHRAEEYEGTGVGLAIVQRIIQRHGGRVWAEAAMDKGATFYFTI